MKIMFWNLGLGSMVHKEKEMNELRNANICRCIDRSFKDGVEIGLFAEYDEFDFNQLLSKLNGQYIRYDGNEGCRRITLLASREYTVYVTRESSRYTTYDVHNCDKHYHIIGLHAEDYRNDPKGTERRGLAEKIIRTIKEDDITEKIIIIGDFNSSLFDLEMLEYDKYNSCYFRDVIKESNYREKDGEKHKRYYNPVLDAISEKNKLYGSFYRTQEGDALVWYCLDQVLISPDLIDDFMYMDYPRVIGDDSLMADVKPNKKAFSDHLPLIVEFTGD